MHSNALILQKDKKPIDSSSAALEKKHAGSGDAATFAGKTAGSGSKKVCVMVGCVYMEFYT